MKLSDFLTDIGRPISYYPGLRKITGSTTATIFLCQMIYWIGKEQSGDGWIYKTSEEIEEEMGLSYDEQVVARRKLVERGIMEEDYKRLEHQMYFRIKLDTLNALWEIPETGNAKMGKKAKPYSTKRASPSSLIGDTDTTKKITTEEVSEIIKKANQEVDAILKFAGMEPGKSWIKLPPPYQSYGKVFCAATGLTYVKSDLNKWATPFETWMAKGHTPGYVLEAINELKAEGKAGQISGPSSITWKLEAMAVARNARAQKAEDKAVNPTVPAGWMRFYEDKKDAPTA